MARGKVVKGPHGGAFENRREAAGAEAGDVVERGRRLTVVGM